MVHEQIETVIIISFIGKGQIYIFYKSIKICKKNLFIQEVWKCTVSTLIVNTICTLYKVNTTYGG